MVHRAILGSIERFFGILTEHYAGAFPMWLAPEQVTLLTIAERHEDFAGEAVDELKGLGLRVETDFSKDKLGAKIRKARLMRIPAIAVVGDREVEQRGVSLRTRADGDVGFRTLEELSSWLIEEAKEPLW